MVLSLIEFTKLIFRFRIFVYSKNVKTVITESIYTLFSYIYICTMKKKIMQMEIKNT